ncbi:MAG: hypothetical protein KatS3mg011_0688 [Acidimicrobiia bacterium]|nr:MAG: hypothetical protein KatS3mg011_0688 [Acidimicrobiia bacterium]
MWAAAALVPVAGAVVAVALLPVDAANPMWVWGAAAVVGVGSLIKVPTTSGSEFTPAAIVVGALPLLARQTPGGIEHIFTLHDSMLVVTLGLTFSWVLRAARGDDPRRLAAGVLRRAASFTVYLWVFDWVQRAVVLPTGPDGSPNGWEPFVHFVFAAGASFMAEVLSAGFDQTLGSWHRWEGRVRLALRDLNVFTALWAAGALFGLAYEAIGWWALAVAALPYLFTDGAFRRLHAARRTYAQMMRALAQIPEVGGHTQPGHAHRTAALASEVAVELGLGPEETETVELAALMHAIGRVTLNEPNILRMGYTDADLARWGSEIVGEASALAEVAEVIRRQHEPYRSPGEDRDPDVPIASRIIKVCSAYDIATAETGFSPLEAMERLHQGSVYDYDPDVVAALRKVLERRGAFGLVRSR